MKCKGKINCDFFVKLAKNAKLKDLRELNMLALFKKNCTNHTLTITQKIQLLSDFVFCFDHQSLRSRDLISRGVFAQLWRHSSGS